MSLVYTISYMPLGRYNFNTLFNYYPSIGVISPKYTTIINGIRLEKGARITPRDYTGGVNLYLAVGKAFAASWDNTTRTITISGVIQ